MKTALIGACFAAFICGSVANAKEVLFNYQYTAYDAFGQPDPTSLKFEIPQEIALDGSTSGFVVNGGVIQGDVDVLANGMDIGQQPLIIPTYEAGGGFTFQTAVFDGLGISTIGGTGDQLFQLTNNFGDAFFPGNVYNLKTVDFFALLHYPYGTVTDPADGTPGTLTISLVQNHGPRPPVIPLQPSSVPEAASWAMMIMGAGAIGGMMRRTRHKSKERFMARVRGIADA